MSDDQLTRINKYICESGFCSRKAADDYVKQGVVFINNDVARLGEKVRKGDTVTLNGNLVKPLEASEIKFIVLNKPVGVVCTAASHDARNVVDFVDYDERIYPVGRLDKDSQGLLFLTNKSDWVNTLLGAGNSHEKEYVVTVNKDITEVFIEGMSNGVPMLGVFTKPCTVVKESSRDFRITLTQGLNRQIRRMCKHFGYSVCKLERVRIMHIRLNGLLEGHWRELTTEELLPFSRMPSVSHPAQSRTPST